MGRLLQTDCRLQLHFYSFSGGAPPFRGYHWRSSEERVLDADTPLLAVLEGIRSEYPDRDLSFRGLALGAIVERRDHKVEDLEDGRVLGGIHEGELSSVGDYVANYGGLVVLVPFRRGMVDIGVFGSHLDTPGRGILSTGDGQDMIFPSSLDEVQELLASVPWAEPDAAFAWLSGPVLPHAACEALISHLEQDATSGSHADDEADDLKLSLTESELSALVGEQVVADLKAVPGFPLDFTAIKLRRCQAAGKCINFHTDVSTYTLQVSLNSDEEYVGGKLVYVNGDGVHFVARSAGSATLHGADILHGVTELVSGTRYGLFFLVEDEAIGAGM
mmetsp:Transcript_21773/g.60520  ORF Transcript_21773/g.60520 Transcript_21773/m.60520 type:complete len:332 (-) Transcript_21773:161-1156(-)|eukprot:CAMPEP_0117656800 /NCGR_PEP_ID=MMETSP0804-20121206/4995_1 /TAXON_ID=1074897 /ORGANISM="Tetraselmis astigmatica, Strain CCMP880" /LENGTH=331 /DNA_ID=CAMNT_0005463221 /DNA_START=121 /DNA_END=1116 /DNA_ORIENTATION=-